MKSLIWLLLLSSCLVYAEGGTVWHSDTWFYQHVYGGYGNSVGSQVGSPRSTLKLYHSHRHPHSPHCMTIPVRKQYGVGLDEYELCQ